MATIAVIGGGASGMAAALAAAESLENHVLLLERQNRVGRKLAATGNGRCNLSNDHAGLPHYHGSDPDFVLPALTRFGVSETLDWFAGLGLAVRHEEGGRIYPLADTAASVVDVLRLALEARNVDLMCGFTVKDARREGDRFLLESSMGEELACDRLIVACGGAAGERLGGSRSGYELLRLFGHSQTALHPSLVQLRTENTWVRAMKGVRTQARLTLEYREHILARGEGEVQFAEYGVTGPAVFDISRAAAVMGEGGLLILRLLPELEERDILLYMTEKRNGFSNLKAENLLTGALHNAIARTVLRRAEIPLDARLWALSDRALEQITAVITRFELPLLGPLGFDAAQVTAGGVETAGFDSYTMASRLVPGLYACGEVLDIDGDCGGYNLQWAWSSGRMAGLAAGGQLS
ncbi:MAG: aminoacetone oxidase family FAD-binding enzyme [Oscillospiraceae bacterium]|nr:aminoacetone oxidase family FAD-binding enzyme [Oscillospiraceae bacterium]